MTGESLWAIASLRLVAGALVGAVFGSFIGAAVVRLPLGRSPLSGRSRCDGCGRALSPRELVPVLSFLVLRGRCRACSAPIDRWQFGAEIGGALVGTSVAWGTTDIVGFCSGLVLGLQLLLLGLLDARHLWLPDRLVLLLAASGLGAGWLRHGSGSAFVTEVIAGGILGFVLLWLPAALYRRVRAREGMGAGDPKLMGAIGLWLGPLGVVLTMLGASLAGLALAAALALGGRKIGPATALPFGSALALAGWLIWLGMGGTRCC